MNEHRTAVFVFALLVAVSAFAGTIGLATGALDLGPTLNHRLPLHSPVLGGVALAIVVGVPATAVAITVRRGDERAGRVAVGAGALLIAWIVVEIAFIREFSFLQPFYAAVGIVFVAIGRRARPRPRQLT
jgi:hypothetical protein